MSLIGSDSQMVGGQGAVCAACIAAVKIILAPIIVLICAHRHNNSVWII